MLIVFDIDGTVANIEHRLDYVRCKPKNWKAFEAGIPNDKVVPQLYEIYHSLVADFNNDIVFASGRNETTRANTEKWLKDNNFPLYRKLYMRKENDFRSDNIVKKEILDEIIKDYGKKPDMVFDDRPGVVQMWRDNGVFVFNVYQGTEDF